MLRGTVPKILALAVAVCVIPASGWAGSQDPAPLRRDFYPRPTETSGRPAEPKRNRPRFVAREVLFRVKSGLPERAKANLYERHGLGAKKSRGPLAFARAPSGRSVASTVKALRKDPAVAWAEPNYRYKATLFPDDPYMSADIAGIPGSRQWAPQAILAPDAWDVTTGTTSTIIAVVDTGVDYSHVELAGRVIKGQDFVSNDGDPMDDEGHGTHVAGIAAARGNNGTGIAGISWNSRILAVKVLDAEGAGSASDVAFGIIYAADNGARVINLSLSGPKSYALEFATAYAYNKGAVVIAAAGNSGGSVEYPAANPDVIAVSATDRDGELADFSNYGPEIDVAAPGVGVTSLRRGNGYIPASGTSMAAPHVAGVAALVMSRNPTWTPDEVEQQLETSADDLGYPGVDSAYGAGQVNAWRALGGTPPVPPPAAGDRFESNNDPSTAWLLPETTQTTATIYPATDVDWFRIEPSAAGNLSIAVDPPIELDVQMRLFDPQLEEVAGADSAGAGGAERFAVNVHANRVYYLQVRNLYGNGSSQTYDLSMSFGGLVPELRVEHQRLTTSPADQQFPAIWRDRVVWEDKRNGNWDIYMKNLATGEETAITSHPAEQRLPAIYANLIVWMDERNGNWDIYAYDVRSRLERAITVHPAEQFLPSVQGNMIVWTDGRNSPNFDVSMEDFGMLIDGDWPFNTDIYGYDLDTGRGRRLTTSRTAQWQAAYWQPYLIYENEGPFSFGGIDQHIVIKNVATGEERRFAPADSSMIGPFNYAPAISYDLAAWGTDSFSSINNEPVGVLAYELTGGRLAAATPSPAAGVSTYGPKVALGAWDFSSGRSHVTLWDRRTGRSQLIGRQLEDQFGPRLFENRVVWTDWRHDNADVYVGTWPDDVPPRPPLIRSATHPSAENWYRGRDLAAAWSQPTDASGISGYSYVLDRQRGTVPDRRVDTTATALTFPNLGQGAWHLHVRARDGNGNWGEPAHRLFKIDSRPPWAGVSTPRYASDVSPTSRFAVRWRALDPAPGSGVTTYDVFVRPDGGKWSAWKTGTMATQATYVGTPGRTHYFKARARDAAGNTGVMSRVRSTVVPLNERNTQIVYSTGWVSPVVSLVRGYYFGSVRHSSTAGAAMTYEYTGRQIALIGTRGRHFGRAAIHLDGAADPIAIVDAYADVLRPRYRRVLFEWPRVPGRASETHTFTVKVLGEKNAASIDYQFDVDALGIRR